MPYLTDVKGFTNESVANDIFPVSIYASLVFYLVAGPVSRRIGLKTFVLLGATCKLWTRILLVWGTSLGAMQFTQVLFAAGTSADAILLAYAYAVARKDDANAKIIQILQLQPTGARRNGNELSSLPPSPRRTLVVHHRRALRKPDRVRRRGVVRVSVPALARLRYLGMRLPGASCRARLLDEPARACSCTPPHRRDRRGRRTRFMRSRRRRETRSTRRRRRRATAAAS